VVIQRPDDADSKYGQSQPSDVIVFLAVLVSGTVLLVASLYGFFVLMYAGY
jgi:hypothetical protein